MIDSPLLARSLSAVLLTCLSACAGRSEPESAPPPPDAKTARKPSEAPTQEPNTLAHETQTTTNDILESVAKARQLPVKTKVNVELIDKAGVRAFVRESMYEDNTPEETQLIGRISAALGVVPLGSDMERVLLDLYQDGVLGIYDPKREALLIGDYVPRAMLAMVVGHEIVHGLQDMHFDLEALQKPHKQHSERDGALTFLVEGDAQAAYLAWRAGDQGPAGISDRVLLALSDQNLGITESLIAYPTLARMMQMPYADGTATVLQLARTQGWAAVDALYRDLPTTTEQMLHLDKLLSREAPHEVTVDAAAVVKDLPAYKVVWQDELGEADILAMLADVLPAQAARQAAAGWGGDRFVVLDRQPQPDVAPLVIGLSSWDTEADAREFEAGFRKYLESKPLGEHVVERREQQVLYATRFAPHLTAQLVRTTGWSSLHASPPPPAPR